MKTHTEQFTAVTRARIELAATDILTLIEGLAADDFARSRLTRKTTVARLHEIATAAAELPDDARAAMPEVDWQGWAALATGLARGALTSAHEWEAASERAAVILQWMRVYAQGR